MKIITRLHPLLLLFLFIIPTSFSDSILFDILTDLKIGFFGFYFYSLAHALYQKLQREHDLNIRLFDLNLVFFVTFYIVQGTFFKDNFPVNSSSHYTFHAFAVIMFPAMFLAGFAVFYCLYWVAKCIVTIQLGRVIHSASFAPTFFLMWLFPISMFWILPAVQNILDEDDSVTAKS